MDRDDGWNERVDSNGLLNPEHHVIARTSFVVTKVMVKAEVCHCACT
jgi:hypothetical protein